MGGRPPPETGVTVCLQTLVTQSAEYPQGRQTTVRKRCHRVRNQTSQLTRDDKTMLDMINLQDMVLVACDLENSP